MDIKKIILLTAVLMIAISFLSIASATPSTNLNGKLMESSINCHNDDEVTYDANIVNDTMKLSNPKANLSFDGSVRLNLTELSDSDIKTLETKLNNGTYELCVYFNVTNAEHSVSTHDFNFTITDKIMEITFNGTKELQTNMEIEDGTYPITWGDVSNNDLVLLFPAN